MLRLRRLSLLSESIFHDFLTPGVISVPPPLCISTFFFQRSMISSAASEHCCCCKKAIDEFSPLELMWSRRYVHVTGAFHSMENNYYDILGIPKDATAEEIKKAFHALAKKYHPDANKKNASAKRKFQQIRDAYEILRDPDKKSRYDSMRDNNRQREYAKHSGGDWDDLRYVDRTEFSNSFHEIFSEIFENGADNTASDIHVELLLTFSEAAQGCTKYLSCESDVPCDSCHGRGHLFDADRKLCPTCQGIGRVTIPPFTTTCHACRGLGRVIKEYCSTCKGSGVFRGVRDVKVTIPPGMDSGDTIRVQNAGNFTGSDMPAGDLIIKFKVAEDPIFSRQGADIFVDAYISFTEAILGGSIEVPTLSGKSLLQIPRGVQHGQLVSLRGKGFPKSGFWVDHGDQYVRFCIKFPLSVTERQRAILEEFEEMVGEEFSSFGGSWWQKWMKEGSIVELSILVLILLFLLSRALN